MERLSHVDGGGRAAMVDVGGKRPTLRTATASGFISLSAGTARLVAENRMKKGDVLTVARIAGIQAAKRTPELVPLCHPLELVRIDVEARLAPGGVRVTSAVACVGRTGVEMEALCATLVALLTVYDMCKAVDKKMAIGDVVLVEKRKTPLRRRGRKA